MEERPTSLFDSCMKQIMKEGDRVNINVNMHGNVEFEFKRKNGNFGVHTISYEEFSKLLNGDLHVEMILSNLIGNAYNQLMEKEGNSTRLSV